MHSFSVIELLCWIAPIVVVSIERKFLKPMLVELKQQNFFINEAMILIPLWFVLIHGFSYFLLDFSFFYHTLLIAMILLALHLYDYVRMIDIFMFKDYLVDASKIMFTYLSVSLIGFMLSRVVSFLF